MSVGSNELYSVGISLHVDDVAHVFPGNVRAIENVSFKIGAGEFLALLGPSGCGKSTLLRLIARLDLPTTGSIQVGGDGDFNPRKDLAFVFQDAHLLPWRTVLHNAALPLELQGVPDKERLAAAKDALDLVGLGEFIERYPAQLSGGMRMRVSIARALVTRPRLLLMDEPFAALDEITRQRLDELLRDLWISQRMTVLFVTHSTQEATFLANRAIVMSRRPGRIVLDHSIDLPEQRTAAMRADIQFAKAMRTLYEALERGEGAAA
jgi:NitT/TauT family transport system ATP-binding protein